MRNQGLIFLQHPFIYSAHALTPNFLPSLSGAISSAIGSSHQRLSPVRRHKDAPSSGTEPAPAAKFLALLPVQTCCSHGRPPPAAPRPRPVTAKTSRIHQRQQPLHLSRRRRCHSLASWLDLSRTPPPPLNQKICPQSLSAKDFLTRPNLGVSSAGRGVISSHFAEIGSSCHSCPDRSGSGRREPSLSGAEEASAVHVLVMSFLLRA